MGQAGGYYGDNNRDGDLTQIVYDRNGTVSGTAQSYIVRSDNLLLNTASCRPVRNVMSAAVCSNTTFGQVRHLHQLQQHIFSIVSILSSALREIYSLFHFGQLCTEFKVVHGTSRRLLWRQQQRR